MLITPANPCGCIAGLFISRQQAQMTKLPSLTNSNNRNTLFTVLPVITTARASKHFPCSARRRVRDDVGEDEDESYGYNEEIAMLEIYSQTCREEALIVTAIVDDEEVEVLIFKGVSSCLTGETAVDPARSVLPERALITKIDRVKGPFNPSQIIYIQKGLSFQEFNKTIIKKPLKWNRISSKSLNYSERSSMTTTRDLPKDVVEEERLCRVPARHLKGLRTTCKRWNYLFNNQRFITKHCDKATKELLVLMLTNESKICPLNINSHAFAEVKSELSLMDPRSSDQFHISKVFHCEGLLLCTSHDTSMLVVWNPCSGQTRWIKAGRVKFARYALGYTKSSSSGSNKSYKVLSYSKVTKTSQIYEFSSDSWRNLDHDTSPQGWRFGCVDSNAMVSLNGHTYGFATDLTETHPGIYLLRFDFTSEKASLLVRLPYKTTTDEIVNLSVVREEKLSVLVQTHSASKTEVWVTNKIDDTTTTVSWNKVLSLDFSPRLQISSFGSFLLDEEKKVVMCYERLVDMNEDKLMDKIYCVGEDSKVTKVYLGVSAFDLEGPHILNYVPSLVQMEQVRGNKRRRDE